MNKHRAWDTTNKRFTSRNSFVDSEGNFYVDLNPNGVDMSGKITIGLNNQIIFAGIYTGRRDKHGIEIFTGDYIQVDYPANVETTSRGEVYFSEFHGLFKIRTTMIPLFQYQSEFIEITGNIYKDDYYKNFVHQQFIKSTQTK